MSKRYEFIAEIDQDTILVENFHTDEMVEVQVVEWGLDSVTFISEDDITQTISL